MALADQKVRRPGPPTPGGLSASDRGAFRSTWRQAVMTAPSSRFFPFLLALFVGSGCAALIYEIVWLQLLQLVIGSSAVSIAVLLGTFMGGMCLGSLGFSRF